MKCELPGSFPIFQCLCRVLGDCRLDVPEEYLATLESPALFDMARSLDLLPALAVRLQQLGGGTGVLDEERDHLLQQALMDNTLRNLQISAQAVKLTLALNRAGVTPLFLKGTAGLLLGESDNIGFRRQVDIDLIVPPEATVEASNALLADGYRFCQFPDGTSAVPLAPGHTASAIRASAAHHHLPPLVKEGYGATVELHTHFLPRRFQHNNPLQPLFDKASVAERHGVSFQMASPEHQLIHLVLGKFVHDGHRSRRTFPIREACDLVQLLKRDRGDIDHQRVRQHCGASYPLFLGLVGELMDYTRPDCVAGSVETGRYLSLLQKRFESPAVARLLDAFARTEHLAHSLVYNPGKMSTYLRRLVRVNAYG